LAKFPKGGVMHGANLKKQKEARNTDGTLEETVTVVVLANDSYHVRQ
jgi:hypothetical protein